MLLISFFKWWYSPGWSNELKMFGKRIKQTADTFSVSILLRTLFSPWKQIISSTYKDSSLEARVKSLIDNVVSRAIGFVVRSITLFLAGAAMFIIGIYSVLRFLLWPLLPVLPFVLLVLGLAYL